MDYPHILAKNLIEDATITYDQTEDAVYRAAHLADRSRLSKFQGANATPQHVNFDLGSAQSINTVVLDRSFVITGGSAQALIQHYSADADYPSGGSWVTDLTMTKAGDLASNTLPIWKTFAAVSRRYWRLRLTGLTAAPVIFNLWLGSRIELTMGPYGEFDPWEERSEDAVSTGVGGGAHVVHRYRQREFRAGFENLTDAQVVLLDSWWSGAGRDGLAWWFLWDPTAYAAAATEATAPVYLISPGARRQFPFNRAVRFGVVEGRETL